VASVGLYFGILEMKIPIILYDLKRNESFPKNFILHSILGEGKPVITCASGASAVKGSTEVYGYGFNPPYPPWQEKVPSAQMVPRFSAGGGARSRPRGHSFSWSGSGIFLWPGMCLKVRGLGRRRKFLMRKNNFYLVSLYPLPKQSGRAIDRSLFFNLF
jgi:hypothetical protein